jgi:PAS domain S-box-containing protein
VSEPSRAAEVVAADIGNPLSGLRTLGEATMAVTDQKQTEDEVLAESLKRARRISHEWQTRLELAQKAGLRIGFWDWNVSANTVVCSDETYRQFGYTRDNFSGSVEELLTRIHPEDRARVDDAIRKVTVGSPEYRAQYRVVHPDGTIRWIDAHGVMLRNSSKRMLGIGIDVTRAKQIEQSLQEAKAELVRVTRLATMGELTASIAHEINQPLAAVVTNGSASLHWLAVQPPNLEEVRKAIQRTIDEAMRASDVIQSIRAMLSRDLPRAQEVDLNEVIRNVLTLTNSELLAGKVTVTLKLAEDLPPVMADPVQLQQVVLNLIMNAIESMSSISDRPRELLIRSQEDSEGVLVQVHDSGPGVAPGQAEQIFRAFFSTKPQGLGMGLSISRSIIESHGGRLWVTSKPPDGAIFEFIVPASNLRGIQGDRLRPGRSRATVDRSTVVVGRQHYD